MVGVVTSVGLGMDRSSAALIGADGILGSATQGQDGEDVYVNAATGNLIDLRTDEILTGIGPDDVISDAYNSLGAYASGLGASDGWMGDYQRNVTGLTGTVNTAGSTITHVTADGGKFVYTYQTSGAYAGEYLGNEGGGAYDTLSFSASANKWTWTDGATQLKEVYDGANGGRIMTSTDANGNVLTYNYTGALLTSIDTTDSGGHQDVTTLTYNGSNQLTSIVTSYWNPQTSSQQTLTQVYYAYDSQGRLSTVTTALTPQDNSETQGGVYVTTYGYQGTSDLINSITQSDGSSLTITYNASNQVASLTQTAASGVTRTTTFTYNSGETTITDPLGIVTQLYYDANGDLTKTVTDPAGLNLTSTFTYDAMGDLLTATAPDNTTTTYTYDGNGNRLTQVDGDGDTIAWTYGAQNQVLSETQYFVAASGGTGASSPTTTWYVYNSTNNLVYTISQTGEVTQYVYNSYGQQTSVIQYTNDFYNTSGLTPTTGPSQATMNSWSSGLSDLANTKRTDTTYDFRGNISTVTSYGVDNSNGTGNTSDTTEISQTTYVYDPSGRLLQMLPSAATTAYVYQGTQRLPTDPSGETYTYDGLGRVLTTTSLTGATTSITYNAATTTATVTLANGLTETSVYDLAGELISYTQAGSGMTTATTTYTYDADGRLMSVTDPTGDVTYYLYNNAGEKVAEILGDGSISVFAYNADGQVDETIQYANQLTSTQLNTLASATPTTPVALSSILPASSASDRYSWSIYDTAHRLIETIDGTGAVTTYAYDGESNLVSTTVWGNLLSGTTLSGFQSSPPTTQQLPAADPGVDQTTRYFYDADGHLVGALNGDGFLTETLYDASGQKTQTIAFATAASQSLWASGTFSQLIASVGTSASDDHTWYVYDSRGFLRGVVDGDGDVTQYHYDPLGNIDQTITGQQLSVSTLLTTPPTMSTLNGLSTTGAGIEVTNYTRNLAGQVLTETQSPASGTTYTTTNVYDSTGDLVETTDATGNVTRYVYDADGRQIYAVNALGDVTQTTYDAAGRVITVRAYANQVASATLNSWGSQITAAQITGAVSTSSSDEVTNNVYDADGRLKYTLDAYLRLTEYDYDSAGNLVQTISYAGDVTAASSYTVAYIQSQITTLGLASLAGNRTTRYVYDADNRLAYSIDAMGDVTAYAYTAAGEQTKIDQYATLYTATGVPTLAAMQSWAAANTTTSDRITRTLYDAAGRAAYEVNADGYVTGFAYNANGEVVTQTAYAAAYSVSDTTTAAQLATLIGSPTGSEVTTFTYDAAWRLLTTTDPLGIVTALTYNAQGLVTDSVLASGTSDAADTHYTYDALGRVLTVTQAYGQPEAATTTYTYDGLGRVLTVSDGDSHVTTNTYNALGEVLTSTDPNGAVTTNVYDAFGNLAETTDGRGYSGFFYHDLLNRLTLQVDPDGYATATTYTIGNQVASVTRYHLLTTGAPTITTPPTINTSSADETTTFTRDKLDRLTTETDAAGYTQVWTYDAFGDQLTDQNQVGGTATYTYDGRGLMTSETLPITNTSAAGTTLETSVTNTYAYDGFGNRIQQVLDSGTNGAKLTTNYVYDLDNRLIQQTSSSVTTTSWTPSGSNGLTQTTTANVTPTTSYVYDRRGNLIEETNPDGDETFYYYDHRNDKIAEVNALGALTEWTYDGAGNVLTQTVYGDFLTSLPSSPGGTPPNPVNASNYRQTAYAYDKDNRLTKTTVESTSSNQILTGSYSGSTYTASSSGVNIVTQTVYDADGNVVETIDGNGNATYYYYDADGRKIGEVDALNYLTTYTLDSDGNVIAETQYATALSPGFSTTTLPTGTPSSNDRTTDFTYDKDGRRLTQTRLNVAYASIGTGGALTTGTANATTTFTYNGLGEVLTVEQATGDTTTYAYDAEGRETSVTTPSYTDASGSTDQPQTLLYYDGLGDLTRSTVGNVGAPVTSDRVTTYSYTAGRLSSTTDPNGFTKTYGYDAAGNVSAISYGRTNSAGVVTTEDDVYQYDALGRVIYQTVADQSGSTWTFADSSDVKYDPYGEMTGKGVNGGYQETFAYDGAGRLISTNSGGGVTVFNLYDADGNQTLQISPAGSSAVSLAGDTLTQAIAAITTGGVIAGAYVTGLNATITQFDAKDEAIKTVDPFRQLGYTAPGGSITVSTISSTNSYDAFGDVVSQTSVLGGVTNYTFNTLGLETSIQEPSVSYTDSTGIIHTGVTPTLYDYYDLAGREVATKDANGNLTTNLLLAGSGYNGSQALVTEQFQPDNGQMLYGYDQFGDETKITNQIGDVETRTYDGDGNLLTQTLPQDTTNGDAALTNFYAYDGLGQRIADTNSELAPSLTVSGYKSSNLIGASVTKETTDYDSEGRLIQSVDYLGNVTGYSYAWSATMATTGLGTFGGWAKTESYAGMTAVTDSDLFGRTVGQTGFKGTTTYDTLASGLVYAFGFDAAGDLVTQTNNDAENIATTYFNTGLTATITDDTDWSSGTKLNGDWYVSDFGYDAAGDKTFASEIMYYFKHMKTSSHGPGITVTGSESLEDETVTFDSLSRVTSLSDTGLGPASIRGLQPGEEPITITYEYDENGNVVHMHSAYTTSYNFSTGTAGTAATEDYWYLYDSMNRVVTTEGVLVNGTRGDGIVRGYQGEDIAFNAAGQRVSDSTSTQYGSSEVINTEYYTYTADGYLATVKVAQQSAPAGQGGTAGGTQTLTGQYTVDAMGRVTTEYDYTSDDPATGSAESDTTTNTYDANSDLTQAVSVLSGGTNSTTTNTYYYDAQIVSGFSFTGAYQGGVITGQKTVTGSTTTTTENYWFWFMKPVEYIIQYIPTPGTTYQTSMTIDGEGHLNVAAITDGASHNIDYFYNSNDEVIDRTDSAGPTQEYYYLGAQVMGETTNAGPLTVDYAQSINAQYKNPTASAAANFDQDYSPVTVTNPGDASGSYTVQQGDTLYSIAQQIWGDSSLWYLIADANGLTAGQTLIAGTTLSIPNKVVNIGNTTSAGTPYSSTQATGYIEPTAPPPPAQHGGCGIIGAIIQAIFTVVGAVFLGPVGAVLGAAVGDAVGQGVSIAVGAQSSFSWDEVALAGIGAFATPIFGPVLGNLVTQGIGIATGLQKSFSWVSLGTAVAETAVFAAVSSGSAQQEQVSGGQAQEDTPGVLTTDPESDAGNEVIMAPGDSADTPQAQQYGQYLINSSQQPADPLGQDTSLVAGPASGTNYSDPNDPNSPVPGGITYSQDNTVATVQTQNGYNYTVSGSTLFPLSNDAYGMYRINGISGSEAIGVTENGTFLSWDDLVQQDISQGGTPNAGSAPSFDGLSTDTPSMPDPDTGMTPEEQYNLQMNQANQMAASGNLPGAANMALFASDPGAAQDAHTSGFFKSGWNMLAQAAGIVTGIPGLLPRANISPAEEVGGQTFDGVVISLSLVDPALSGAKIAAGGYSAFEFAGAERVLPQVTTNRIAGNAFRDEIAGALQAEGRDVATEVYKSTPFGKRFIDIEVSKDGQVLGGIETKLGTSSYTWQQQLKDWWLGQAKEYTVTVVRNQ